MKTRHDNSIKHRAGSSPGFFYVLKQTSLDQNKLEHCFDPSRSWQAPVQQASLLEINARNGREVERAFREDINWQSEIRQLRAHQMIFSLWV
jgi:hypothetical protein